MSTRLLWGWVATATTLTLTVPLFAPAAPVAVAAPRTTSVVSGFTDEAVTTVGSPTTIETLPDGTVVVLGQSGAVRLVRDGVLLPTPAATLSVCSNSERGLLGFTHSPDFIVDRQVFMYYTANAVSGDTLLGLGDAAGGALLDEARAVLYRCPIRASSVRCSPVLRLDMSRPRARPRSSDVSSSSPTERSPCCATCPLR